MTADEYLAFERESEFKHEFIGGEIYAMTGASRHHNLIAGATYVALYTQLRKKGCEIYPSDMKVHSPVTGSYVYPDITIVCGDAELNDDHEDILLNPTLIIEVLSPSTEAYDRGEKFRNYWAIPSLAAYVLVAQDRPRLERSTRAGDSEWLLTVAEGLDASLALPSIDCTLALAEVYEQITFE
jgi:Uma2 family endonuclease